jgi:hypothetical protein
MLTLAIILLSIVPVETVVTDRVDLCERNHVFNYEGEPVPNQWIFWNEQDEIIDWRNCHSLHGQQLLSGHTLTFWEGAILRRVRFKHFRETWTQDYDPEVWQHRFLVPGDRRKLSPPLKREREKRKD